MLNLRENNTEVISHVKYKCATQEGGWIGNLKIILANPHNKQSNVLIKIESNKFVQSKHNN